MIAASSISLQTNARSGFVCLRLEDHLFAKLTDKIYDALPKTSICDSKIPCRRNPVQIHIPERRRFLFRREDFLSPFRELLPNYLPHQVVIKLVRGTSQIPPVQWTGIQPEGSLNVSERRVSDVYPVWRETAGESGGAIFATDDVHDFAVGVV